MTPHFSSDSGIRITLHGGKQQPWRNKQMELDRSHTYSGNFGTYQANKKIDSENFNALLLENVEEQKRNNEMPKGARLGKTG